MSPPRAGSSTVPPAGAGSPPVGTPAAVPAAVLLGLLLQLPATLPVAAVGPGSPARGKVLVATDRLFGPYFPRTVVLLLDHDESGSTGVVLNRPSSVPLVEVLVDPAALGDREGPVYRGGPVSPGTMTILARRAAADGLTEICDGVVRIHDDEGLRTVVDDPEVELRVYAGYAGWAPGQLDSELQRGSWHVLDADVTWVFFADAEPDALWRRLERLATLPLV